MTQQIPSIIVLGLEFYATKLLEAIAPQYPVIAVDISKDKVEQVKSKLPDVQYVVGDVGSILTWKKLDLSSVRYIVSTVKDVDVNVEVCRIIRETYRLPTAIIIARFDPTDEKLFEAFNVTIINPLALSIQAVMNRLEKNYTRAVNIGLGKGEIIEVNVVAPSHLTDKKLKLLRPSNWHIASVYRNQELLLPTGDIALEVGDRAILVGHAKVLENVAGILIKGEPQFPLQYGANIVFPLKRCFVEYLPEAKYWLANFRAQKVVFLPYRDKVDQALMDSVKEVTERYELGAAVEICSDIFKLNLSTGLLIVPDSGRLSAWRVRTVFRYATKPFLVARGTAPYQGIIVSLNGPEPALALETALEAARLTSLPFKVLNVTFPKALRGSEEEADLRQRWQLVSDFEGIFKLSIDYQVIEGNPVRETLKYVRELPNHLLITIAERRNTLKFRKPHAPYLITQRTKLSTLVIPSTEAYD